MDVNLEWRLFIRSYDMKKSDIFWQTYLNLEKEAIEVSKYIFVTDEVIKNKNGVSVTENCYTQIETFSPYIADLLVRTCVQIEAVSKELYFDNGGEKARGDSTVLFDDDCLRLIDKLWSTHSKSVLVVAPFFNLTKEEHRILKPLKEAHRRHEYWEKAYQAVKHDRYSYLYMGNVKAFIQALAALYLLNVYFRNEKWTLRYEDVRKRDYSMGSSLFAVNPPVLDALWEGNEVRESDSPFVVRYQDAVYQQIDDIRKKENDALSEFMRNQPEWNDPEFLAYIKDVVEKANGGRVMGVWEIAKYRLMKMIPTTLPFERRKELLLNSEAWNGWVNQHNIHLKPEDINESNIQGEINIVGVHWGMDLMKRYQRLEWLPIAMNSGLCDIYIPKKNLAVDNQQS